MNRYSAFTDTPALFRIIPREAGSGLKTRFLRLRKEDVIPPRLVYGSPAP